MSICEPDTNSHVLLASQWSAEMRTERSFISGGSDFITLKRIKVTKTNLNYSDFVNLFCGERIFGRIELNTY